MTRSVPALALVGAALVLVACDSRSGVAVAPPPSPRTLSVAGEGFVMAKPDLATVSVGVVTDGDTASLALAENNTRMSALFQKIAAMGVPDTDIRTSDLSVYPRYADHDPAKPATQPGIIGYSVSNTVTVTLRDLQKLGGALDQFVSAAGANTINSLTFGFADSTALQDGARRKAVADAKRKADLYVEAAGVKLGALREIQEESSYVPTGYLSMQARSKEMSAVPVASGESKVTANVRLIYGLE